VTTKKGRVLKIRGGVGKAWRELSSLSTNLLSLGRKLSFTLAENKLLQNVKAIIRKHTLLEKPRKRNRVYSKLTNLMHKNNITKQLARPLSSTLLSLEFHFPMVSVTTFYNHSSVFNIKMA